MADDFHDSVLDEFFEGFASFPSTASAAFGSPPFHRGLGGPFAPPSDIGFGTFCPRHIGGAAHPLLDFAAAASSTLSSIGTTAARIGTSWPRHRSSPWTPPRQPPQPELPRLPALRELDHAGPSSASRTASSRASRGLPTLHRRATPARRDLNSDDYYLNEIATGNFSSPSIFNENPRQPDTAIVDSARESSPWPTTGSSSNNSGGQASGGDIKSEPTGDDFEMPARRTARRAATPAEASRPTRKRAYDDMIKSEDDPFADRPDETEIIDLSATEQVPDSLKEPKRPKNELKLSKFQCVICMDDTSSLTITHCGHLFCGECLHSSLHIDSSKKICPICRQKVETRPPSGKFGVKAKGYYPLQLKVLTKKSLGKRAAQ